MNEVYVILVSTYKMCMFLNPDLQLYPAILLASILWEINTCAQIAILFNVRLQYYNDVGEVFLERNAPLAINLLPLENIIALGFVALMWISPLSPFEIQSLPKYWFNQLYGFSLEDQQQASSKYMLFSFVKLVYIMV